MDNFKGYYEKLNKNQKKAVDLIDSQLLVLAGPGTGKTELLSIRAANIIRQKKANPDNILVLTYTNAGAKAMKERLVGILNRKGYDIETGTFHSFANSIILESEEAANYIQDRIQITDLEKIRLLEYILDHTDNIDSIRPFRAPYTYRSAIDRKISELKKEGIEPKGFEAYVKNLKPDNIYIEDKHVQRLKALAVVYKLYEEYKAGKNKAMFDERGRYDFDDMIIIALRALRNEKNLKQLLQAQFSYVMVDEFQDTNGAQFSLLLEILGSDSPNLCCVGDDDQSIYRFQGASVGNFKLLKKYFPKLGTISLKENYRSVKEIINISGMIINNLPKNERMGIKDLLPQRDYADKNIEFHEFTTAEEELLFIANKVKNLKKAIEKSPDIPDDEKRNPYNNIAVLVRKRDDILKVVDTFLSAGIPYATDGKEDISAEKRVRQMLDIIRLANTTNIAELVQKDTLLYSVLTSDYFGICLNDVLEIVRYMIQKRRSRKGAAGDITLFQEMMAGFDFKDIDLPFDEKSVSSLGICKILQLEDPCSISRALWAIKRFIKGVKERPVHAALLQYIDDANIYRFILSEYADNEILRTRDLRSLSSFVNMVKQSDINNPALSLKDLVDDIETQKEHDMPLVGNLVTMSQNGVRVFTAHASKGLEFHSVFIPFCLQDKNWPIKQRADLIPLPADIFKTKEKANDKAKIKELGFYDETRLFYVASTRAKCNLVYTASPRKGAVSSSYIPAMGLENMEAGAYPNEEEVIAQSLRITEKKDPFVGTEHILSDMIDGLTLNPTSLNNYINCPRKFLYNDILRLPSQKKLGLTFGNCVHKALEDTYRDYMQTKAFPDFLFFERSFLDELKYQGVEQSIHSACRRQVYTLKKWFKKQAEAPVMPLGLEKKLSVMLSDDLVFTGKYDKTELVSPADEGSCLLGPSPGLKKNLIRVVDYKTGKPDQHVKKISIPDTGLFSPECDGYLRQLVAYKLLYDRDKIAGKQGRVIQGRLVFVEPAKTSVIKYGLKKGEFVDITVDITEEMVCELENVIQECWKSIKHLAFNKLRQYDNTMEKCGGCDYKNICW
jgi:DNA helicase II / ATP-dependent DNA helicase PcrA